MKSDVTSKSYKRSVHGTTSAKKYKEIQIADAKKQLATARKRAARRLAAGINFSIVKVSIS